MNIDLTITEQKTIKKEIELPYYARSACYFLMVAENEKIISVQQSSSCLGVEIEMLKRDDVCYDNRLILAAKGEEITESEFMNAYELALSGFEKSMFPEAVTGKKY